MSYSIANDKSAGGNRNEYTIYATSFYSVLGAKFFGSCALHLIIYPEIFRSMELMKYTLNHASLFTNEYFTFIIALTAHTLNIMAEMLNIYFLLYQPLAENCIIYFVALVVIVEIPYFYTSALINDKLKDELQRENKHFKIFNRGAMISWKSRSLFNKLGRIIYRCHRAFYVAVIFYF